MFPAFMATPVGGLYVEQVAIGSARRDPVWDLIRREQDMDDGIGYRLPGPAGVYSFLDVRRGFGQDNFETTDIELLQIIAPHVSRARKIELNMQAAPSFLPTAEASLPFGAMIVDGTGRIVTMNAVAEAIMMRSDTTLSARGGYVHVRDAREAAALRTLIGAVCTVTGDIAPAVGGDLLLHADRGMSKSPDLVVSVAPFVGPDDRSPWRDACAVLHLREIRTELPVDFEQCARAFYGLTAKEAGLSRVLAEGCSLRRAAEIQGIAFSTARSYLESIFVKTGCRQQSQLVALMCAVQPLRLL
jgi:DNA-binding CsgD family transcriptional regulator